MTSVSTKKTQHRSHLLSRSSKALSALLPARQIFRGLPERFTNLQRRPINALLHGIMLAATLGLVSTSTVQSAQNLPNMGEPADNALSPAAERELGEQFMRQIRASVPLVRDIQVGEYIEGLGTRLAAHVDTPQPLSFTFFVIDNPNINAFAVPGGFVGFNAGIIRVLETEEQLAAVVAHEISHITQRHHARASASGNRTRLTTAFAVLAAILIGQSNPQAGHAALAAGLAATQQSLINFTRLNEYEADRIGIEVLANAGFAPTAMAEAFEILRRKNAINTSGAQLEYLRTHPLDTTRIAEAKNRAASLGNPDQPNDSVDFEFFKARLSVLGSTDNARLRREFSAQTEKSASTTQQQGAQYALAMLDLRERHYKDARNRLQPLLQIHPDNLNLQLLTAETDHADGKLESSNALLEQLISLYPASYSAVQIYADQLISQREMQSAHATVTEYLRSTDQPNPGAWLQLANIHQKLGDEAASHESLSRYFKGLNELGRAREQLELALRAVANGSQAELRIIAEKKALDLVLGKN